jgi:hypothetical protein
MKSYMTNERINLVGKAWEVRRFLQVLTKDAAYPDQTMVEYLAKFNRTGPRPEAPKRPEPQRKRSGKKADPA